jgi:hypothetical protein
MSQKELEVVQCPRCAATWSTGLFHSLHADQMPAQIEAILDGSFERATCQGCGCAFRPEHRCLFVSLARDLWIVMYPLAHRRRFAALEEEALAVIHGNFARAPAAVAAQLSRVQPRLVFGQHMLSEAVRLAAAGLDPSLVECAKLLAVRRNLAQLLPHGPFELCVERVDPAAEAVMCAVHAVPTGERVADYPIPGAILDEARDHRGDLQARFPDLFDRPYLSATRYLLGDTI